jgi:hypothetical protein
MKYITTFLKKKELLRPMGRWNIDYCNKKINRKIDLSNEDHCGPCGQYIKTKIDLQNKSIVPYTIKIKDLKKI